MTAAPEGPVTSVPPVTVLILDDSETILEVLRDALETDPTVVVVGASRRVTAAIRLAAETQPRVAVVDINMPEGGGWAAARGRREVCPDIRVVGHSAYDDALMTHTMIAAGMSALVSKGDDLELLLAAIHGSDVMPTESDYRYLRSHHPDAVARPEQPDLRGSGRTVSGRVAVSPEPG